MSLLFSHAVFFLAFNRNICKMYFKGISCHTSWISHIVKCKQFVLNVAKTCQSQETKYWINAIQNATFWTQMYKCGILLRCLDLQRDMLLEEKVFSSSLSNYILPCSSIQWMCFCQMLKPQRLLATCYRQFPF